MKDHDYKTPDELAHHTPKLMSTHSYIITNIPRYWPWIYEYLSQPLGNDFIGSGQKNWTIGYIRICKKLMENDSIGVLNGLFDTEDLK